MVAGATIAITRHWDEFGQKTHSETIRNLQPNEFGSMLDCKQECPNSQVYQLQPWLSNMIDYNTIHYYLIYYWLYLFVSINYY